MQIEAHIPQSVRDQHENEPLFVPGVAQQSGCLRAMHRLHIVILHPLLALGMPWKHEHVCFFLGETFFLSHGQRKEGSRGEGGSFREQRKGTARNGNMFPYVPGTHSRNTKKPHRRGNMIQGFILIGGLCEGVSL